MPEPVRVYTVGERSELPLRLPVGGGTFPRNAGATGRMWNLRSSR